jgi:hypothetical protein
MQTRWGIVVSVAGAAWAGLFLPGPGEFRRTDIFVREVAAWKAIRTINQMQIEYQTQYGRFAGSLVELGPAAADLIGNDLANGVKQGYKFTVAAIPGGYTINANPVVYGRDGRKTFYSDQNMVIRENYGPEPATASSREHGAVDNAPK